MRGFIVLLSLMLVLEACASSGTAASAPGTTRSTATRRTNVITAAELAEHPNLASAEDAIRQLRPQWPTRVDVGGQTYPLTIFMNNNEFGGYASLSQITARTIAEIRYLTQSEAQMKWSSKYRDVIQVITK
jgi:hypothetical protein